MNEQYGACAENSLFIIAKLLKKDVSYSEIQRLVDPDGDGEASFRTIAHAAKQSDLVPVGIDLGVNGTALLRSPSILHVRRHADDGPANHFVVYLGRASQGKICILDPPRVPMLIAPENLAKLWTGKALVICPSKQKAANYKRNLNVYTRSILAEPLSWSGMLMLLLLIFYRAKQAKRDRAA